MYKTFALAIAIILHVTFLLAVLKLLVRKLPGLGMGELSRAGGTWFAALLAAGILNSLKGIDTLSNAFGNIYAAGGSNLPMAVLKTFCSCTGVSLLWFLFVQLLSAELCAIFVGRRKNLHELAADNYPYFIIKGALLLAVTLCLWPVLESILLLLTQDTQLPFYH
ncbi:hypothetical protein DCC81_18830 [Chitinophaga parva]|uniref:Uncharacterized protein n=1 Tax=Chitinophaga parva TaxID=2169414 RepID=A0A2T7BJ12_9BACT|nr:hypothetical protein [Chitinophaga parva]PUZ26279.1 hypothetical protein DCC81_18830 [Chitinophaga parva]